MNRIATEPGVARFGVFEVDLHTGELRKKGQRLRIPGQSFQVLKLLLERPGELVSRDELREKIWGSDTFVDFEHGLNAAVNRLREALGDSADSPRFVETLPRRGYRFIAPLQGVGESVPEPAPTIGATIHLGIFWKVTLAAAIAVVALAAAGYKYLQPPKLNEKDTVVLADLANQTGDPIFDDTLKTALDISLRQSPFLDVLSDQKVGELLQLMTRPAGTKLTPNVARELCQRAGSKVYVAGSISSLGSVYVLELKAVNCGNGNTFVAEQTAAMAKEKVLDALGNAASKLRRELGESVGTVQKYDVPLSEATTSSLAALKALSLGDGKHAAGEELEAIGLYQHAIELDRNFALAYARLGTSYSNRGETVLAEQNQEKAFELRERTSEREKLYITAHYYADRGQLDKGIAAYKLYKQSYPRDLVPYNNLANIYTVVGQFESALENARQAVALDTGRIESYGPLVTAYTGLNRIDEARATINEAFKHSPNNLNLHMMLAGIAFSQNDFAVAEEELERAQASGDEGEYMVAGLRADLALYHGELRRGQAYFHKMAVLAQKANLKEGIAGGLARQAVYEAIFGLRQLAIKTANDALRESDAWEVAGHVALALVLAGQSARGQQITDRLTASRPYDTFAQNVFAPLNNALAALNRGDTARATDMLNTASFYAPADTTVLYARGITYLRAGQTEDAVQSFRKILDLRAVDAFDPLASLAYLRLAQAYASQGDLPHAQLAYQYFLTLWKDADPDIPILMQAKAQYAKLH